MNQWLHFDQGYILTKLAQIHHWEDLNKLLDFRDHDLILKVTRAI